MMLRGLGTLGGVWGREKQASEQAVMSQDKKLQDMMGSGKGAGNCGCTENISGAALGSSPIVAMVWW